MLTISHVYGHGYNKDQISKLSRLGLRLRPRVSRYMGAQICHFIDFQEGPSLELIEVENEKEYSSFVPKGMKPYCPGIELLLPKKSGKNLRDFKLELAELKPYDLHVNYDGSIDSTKPGCNYLNFEIPLVKDTFIWLNQSDEPRPILKKKPDHPNGVREISGLLFNLENANLERFSELIKRKIVDEDTKTSKLRLWSRKNVNDFPTVQNKLFPLCMIVLKTHNLKYFMRGKNDFKEVSFMSHPAIHIKTNKLSWDLLITKF